MVGTVYEKCVPISIQEQGVLEFRFFLERQRRLQSNDPIDFFMTLPEFGQESMGYGVAGHSGRYDRPRRQLGSFDEFFSLWCRLGIGVYGLWVTSIVSHHLADGGKISASDKITANRPQLSSGLDLHHHQYSSSPMFWAIVGQQRCYCPRSAQASRPIQQYQFFPWVPNPCLSEPPTVSIISMEWNRPLVAF